ncbi:hypothetical protein [Pseudonocardia sp. N23]|uniref:hypothetical protein n=1 Tax=Pseudonocardia sp. N23 TaxID=1987376 RepID=UPI000BFB371C|nr:hypothetical protein [Pseudonocardia sp. N23]GAY12059.1 phage protein [Pseudonocardia sp. N23]
MANRGYAQIFTSIWTDDDFRKVSERGQRLYFVLLSQADINYAGVLPLTVGRWARCCTAMTRRDVEDGLDELADRGYVVLDWDTEELLVRSFMRNDGLWKQPRMLGVALREALGTASQALRQALARECGRLREALGTPSGGPQKQAEHAEQLQKITDAEKQLLGDPDEALEDPLGTPSGGLPAYARAAPAPTPTPTPSPGTHTATESPTTQPEGGSLDPYPRESNDPPPQPRPEDRCATHVGTDHDGPCRACAGARRAAEQWDADHAKRLAADRRACRWCDADGWRIHPEARHLGPTGDKCDHTPPKDHPDA